MNPKDRYAPLDDETFDRILWEAINDSNPTTSDVLQIPGVYEILKEHYNNEVLERWEEEHTCDECGAIMGDPTQVGREHESDCSRQTAPEFNGYQE